MNRLNSPTELFLVCTDQSSNGFANCSSATKRQLGKTANLPLFDPVNPTAIQRVTYTLAGQTIAVHITGDPISSNNGIFYLYSDHLGSTNVMSYYKLNNGTDHSQIGLEISGSRAYYQPFGRYRGTAPTQTLTDRQFTSQQENLELGLYYYNARYYLPGVGRFISADTLIPNPQNPQSFNRYSYVLNNPINFTDPTGHRECGLEGIDCENPELHERPPVRTPIEVNDWERQLLTMTAWVEMHGHGNVQAEAIIWVAFNRMEGTKSLEGNRSYPNSNFSGTSQIAGYILSTSQFAVGHVIIEEYGLLEIDNKEGGNKNFKAIDGMTVQEVVAQAYERMNNFYGGDLDDLLEQVVNPVIDAYNSGEADPTYGSVFYGHVTPATKDLNVAYLFNYAESLGVSNQVQYRLFESTKIDYTGNPANYLIVNNLIALPQVK